MKLHQFYIILLTFAVSNSNCLPQLNFGQSDNNNHASAGSESGLTFFEPEIDNETKVQHEQISFGKTRTEHSKEIIDSDLIFFPTSVKNPEKPELLVAETTIESTVEETVDDDKLTLEDLCPQVTTEAGKKFTRYDKTNKKCSITDAPAHCPENMKFYSYPDSQVYGECDCSYSNGFLKPLIYDLERNRCYKLFEQGYCKSGQWITLTNEENPPKCTRNKCMNIFAGTVRQNSSDYIFYNGECVKFNGKHKDCKESQVLSFDGDDLFPKCMNTNLANTRVVGSFSKLKCKPGTYRSVSGKCQEGFTWGK